MINIFKKNNTWLVLLNQDNDETIKITMTLNKFYKFLNYSCFFFITQMAAKNLLNILIICHIIYVKIEL